MANKMPNTIETRVAGVSFGNRQGYLHWINKRIKAGSTSIRLMLERERKNPDDANAIKVVARDFRDGKHVPIGYVPRDLAAQLAPIMDSGRRTNVRAYEVSGKPWTTLGVKMTVAYE